MCRGPMFSFIIYSFNDTDAHYCLLLTYTHPQHIPSPNLQVHSLRVSQFWCNFLITPILYNSSVNVYYRKISNHCNPTTKFSFDPPSVPNRDLNGSESWGFCFTISKVCPLNYQSRPKSLSSKLVHPCVYNQIQNSCLTTLQRKNLSYAQYIQLRQSD